MPRSLPLLAAAALLAALSLLLTSCAAPATANAVPNQQSPNVFVTVNGCGTNSIFIKVNPWVATVERGQNIRWLAPTAGIDSMAIRAKNDDHWAFDWAQPGQAQRRATLPGQAVQGQNAAGRDKERFPYHILIYCRDDQGQSHLIDIDPEIMIEW